MKIWKEKYKKLEETSDKKIKELEKQLRDFQSSKEPLVGEIVGCNSRIKSKKNEISDLENKIVAKEEEIAETQVNDLVEKLKKEKESLEVQLQSKEKELAELQKKNKELEGQFFSRLQNLQKKINEKRSELEEKKNGQMGKQEKDELCRIQAEITKLEVELNDVEAIRQTFGIEVLMYLPRGLVAEEKIKEEDDIKNGNMDYDTMHPNYLLKEFEERKTAELPARLIDIYNVKKDELEKIEVDKVEDLKKSGVNIENYAILSYSWKGSPWAKFRGSDEETNIFLHSGGKKSLRKAIEACKNKKINTNYLWMDCYCIDQKNKDDVDQELKKTRQYYINAKVTLVPIQREIGISLNSLHPEGGGRVDMDKVFSAGLDIVKEVVNSSWFERSWTLKEGLLSRQTVFMFDDVLIDGRFLAMVWSNRCGPEVPLPRLTTKDDRFRVFFEKYSKKAATPLGWAYYEPGYNEGDKIDVGLWKALKGVERRKRYMPVDGIYSILGLLPYGNEIKPEYKNHNDYTEQDFVKALTEIMEVAVKNGYGEPLAWCGKENGTPGLCWLPEIKEGGIKGVELEVERVRCEPNSVEFTENGIKIKGSKYEVVGKEEIVGKKSDKLCNRKLLVNLGNGLDNRWINLRGRHEILEKIKEDETVLLVPSRYQWKSGGLPVALLAYSPNDKSYHRIDLVKILEGTGYLTNLEEELTVGKDCSLNTEDSLKLQQDSLQEESQKTNSTVYEAYIKVNNLTHPAGVKKW